MPSLPNTITLKRGRKPLPESERRNYVVTIKMSEGEMNQLKSLADRMNQGMSGTIRKAVEQAYEKI